MADELIDKFKADIQISRARTGKNNAILLTIGAAEAEELITRLEKAEQIVKGPAHD